MKYGKPIYLVKKKTLDNGVIEYEEPKEIILQPYNITIMPVDLTKGNISVQEYGMLSKCDWIGIVYKHKCNNSFSIGDLLYLDGAKPIANDENHENANAIISNILEYNFTLKLLIKSRVMEHYE